MGLSVHQIMLNKEVLPVVEALLQVWSTPRAHLLKDKYPCLNGFGTRHLDLGEYAKRHDLSKEREEEQRKLTVAIGLALEANPPARKTDSLVDFYEDSNEREVAVITWPALKDCLSEDTRRAHEVPHGRVWLGRRRQTAVRVVQNRTSTTLQN